MQQEKIIIILGLYLVKLYFCSKQNCQNRPKDVFVKHALKLKFLSSNSGKPNRALNI